MQGEGAKRMFWKTHTIIIILYYALKLITNSPRKSEDSENSDPKSTENIFSVDNKSTMIFLKTPETRYQPASLF